MPGLKLTAYKQSELTIATAQRLHVAITCMNFEGGS